MPITVPQFLDAHGKRLLRKRVCWRGGVGADCAVARAARPDARSVPPDLPDDELDDPAHKPNGKSVRSVSVFSNPVFHGPTANVAPLWRGVSHGQGARV